MRIMRQLCVRGVEIDKSTKAYGLSAARLMDARHTGSGSVSMAKLGAIATEVPQNLIGITYHLAVLWRLSNCIPSSTLRCIDEPTLHDETEPCAIVRVSRTHLHIVASTGNHLDT